ncbi:hypothetical protein NP493_397g00000 [Ridgeia piscesae]|uniref:Uncharacterized protein n=1 Tax=Ridgeia piscesae TaxID=27915 RepID=A0AAD9NSS5_RIDPI|nr:hypothetical protein NP493_397g00000 [Ridgeia piscesae]
MHFKLSRNSASVVLLFLAICCTFLGPIVAVSPEAETHYQSCIGVCDKDKDKCYADCEGDSTCEASRRLCKILCIEIAITCQTKCIREIARIFGKN